MFRKSWLILFHTLVLFFFIGQIFHVFLFLLSNHRLSCVICNVAFLQSETFDVKIGIWRYFLFDLEETLDSQTWRLFSKCFEVSIFLHQTTASAWLEGCALFRASTESKFFKTRWKIKFRAFCRYNEINNINRFKRELNSLYILSSKKPEFLGTASYRPWNDWRCKLAEWGKDLNFYK